VHDTPADKPCMHTKCTMHRQIRLSHCEVVFRQLYAAITATATPNAVQKHMRIHTSNNARGFSTAEGLQPVVISHNDAKDRCTHLVRSVQQTCAITSSSSTGRNTTHGALQDTCTPNPRHAPMPLSDAQTHTPRLSPCIFSQTARKHAALITLAVKAINAKRGKQQQPAHNGQP
jgi:hypothetical protein